MKREVSSSLQKGTGSEPVVVDHGKHVCREVPVPLFQRTVSWPPPWRTPARHLEEGRGASGASSGFAILILLALVHALAPGAMAEDNVRLDCMPRAFQVVPGEAIRLQLTVQADSAMPFRLRVPNEPLLKLRAIEKIPVRRTPEGLVVYKRVVVWQGLEPGKMTIETLSLETKKQKLLFPAVTVTVRDPTP